MKLRSAIVIAGLALVAPACATTERYEDRPVHYARVVSAYDEGFRHGLDDGRWAAHRDYGRPYRRSFWDDGRYRAATNGYRPQFGSKFEYQDGFRAGYERGYWERHGHDHERRRY
jgi:hypothetical protein